MKQIEVQILQQSSLLACPEDILVQFQSVFKNQNGQEQQNLH